MKVNCYYEFQETTHGVMRTLQVVVDKLKVKYPDIRLKSLLAVEHLTYSEQKLMLENFYEDKFKSLL